MGYNNLKEKRMSISAELKDKKKRIAVVGLGYVGLPIALELARTMSVIGFDINEERLEELKNG